MTIRSFLTLVLMLLTVGALSVAPALAGTEEPTEEPAATETPAATEEPEATEEPAVEGEATEEPAAAATETEEAVPTGGPATGQGAAADATPWVLGGLVIAGAAAATAMYRRRSAA